MLHFATCQQNSFLQESTSVDLDSLLAMAATSGEGASHTEAQTFSFHVSVLSTPRH